MNKLGLIVNSVAKFSPTKQSKLNQTEFLTNQGINSYLFTEGALDFSQTKRNLLLILEISHQPVGEKCHTQVRNRGFYRQELGEKLK